MKLSKSDLKLMRWSLLAIGLSALLSGMVLFFSSQYEGSAAKNMRTAQAGINDARNRLTTAQQDRENMSTYASEYARWEKRNVLGDDHRLDWIEGLEKLRQQNLVSSFRYTISPQKNYVAQPAIDSGNFDIRYSKMKLQFDLLHEGQLPNFLNALHQQRIGWYQLESCSLQRSSGSVTEQMDNDDIITDKIKTITPQITAECDGGWITLKNRNNPS